MLACTPVLPQPGWPPDLPVVHDQDAVTVEDSGDAVGDDQHRAALEGFTDRVLDQGIGLQVDRGCGFIDDEDLADTDRG